MTLDAPFQYDEFAYFHQNAQEYGIAYSGPPKVRRTTVVVDPETGRRLSALVWGERPPELVLVHGGAQNAHTWDTVALALDRPLVAVDLAGHGHSDFPEVDGLAGPRAHAADVEVAVRTLAPDAAMVVGMSLGGLTSMALAGRAPDIVRRLVLVDVTPGGDRVRASRIAEFVSGPEAFETFDEILQRTIEFNPGRSVESLQRGILHNAVQREDGRWVWRHRRSRAVPFLIPQPADDTNDRATDAAAFTLPDYTSLWDDLESIRGPVLLVHGTTDASLVDESQIAEFRRRQPRGRVVAVEGAGHSVQGDRPIELAALIEDFLTT